MIIRLCMSNGKLWVRNWRDYDSKLSNLSHLLSLLIRYVYMYIRRYFYESQGYWEIDLLFFFLAYLSELRTFIYCTQGALMEAVGEGWWLLLDEINLASAETLQCLSGILENSNAPLLFMEKPWVKFSCFKLYKVWGHSARLKSSKYGNAKIVISTKYVDVVIVLLIVASKLSQCIYVCMFVCISVWWGIFCACASL